MQKVEEQAQAAWSGAGRTPGVVGSMIETALRRYGRMTPSSKGAYRLVRTARQAISREQWRGVFTTPSRAGGLEMWLDLAEYPDCCMAYGLYERETERAIERLLLPGDHFVDGGANIGYFTLRAARRVGPSGRVDAFEPQPMNRVRLMENLRRNGLDRQVNVHPLALSNSAGEAAIHFYAGGATDQWYNHGCSTMFAEAGHETTTTMVRTVRMDEVLTGTRPRLVKLDVQGAEPLVIEGMAGLLRGNAPAVIVEWERTHVENAGFRPHEIVHRLMSAVPSYGVYVIGVRWRRIDPTDAVLDDLGTVNLLFLP
jgi:FkbM family methyltransferase